MTSPLLLGSITDAGLAAAGRVLVCGSHGGRYVGYLAAKAQARAVILNDAGVGLEGAGVAGVMALGKIGMAAAAATCESCRIGDADDMMARGVIGTVNPLAADLGLAPGQRVAAAAVLLAVAAQATGMLPAIAEARETVTAPDLADGIVLVDSAALVTPEDAGRIVVTGSHGGLIGGDPARALKARALFAVFNDAGIGADGAGVTRLAALDGVGVAAATVSHMTARIGEARSALATGVISHVNAAARAMGAVAGRPLADWSWLAGRTTGAEKRSG